MAATHAHISKKCQITQLIFILATTTPERTKQLSIVINIRFPFLMQPQFAIVETAPQNNYDCSQTSDVMHFRATTAHYNRSDQPDEATSGKLASLLSVIIVRFNYDESFKCKRDDEVEENFCLVHIRFRTSHVQMHYNSHTRIL